MTLSQLIKGETATHFISDMLEGCSCKISRIVFSVTFSSELKYLDQQTLTHVFKA